MASLTCVLEPFISSKGLDAIYIGKLDCRGFAYVHFYKGDVECHHGVDEVLFELERCDIKVV